MAADYIGTMATDTKKRRTESPSEAIRKGHMGDGTLGFSSAAQARRGAALMGFSREVPQAIAMMATARQFTGIDRMHRIGSKTDARKDKAWQGA